jgi:hypothetical protein|tara:strand:- start:4142 stop:6013 length:1872 start_codon:yes stop_codon:yes gene_type:complete
MASTDSKLTKLNFLPGFHKESTQYAEEGKWFEGNRIRFREGKPENIRGYAKHNTNNIEGIARDILTWSDNDTRKHIIVGTNKEVIVEKDAVLYDVTPIVSVVSASNIFTTTNGSIEVVTSITNHGRSAGDSFIIEGSDAVGGITLVTLAPYTVTSVTNINKFIFNANTTATGTATGGGTAVSVAYLLKNELADSIQGLGYGADIYNAGTSTTGVRAWNDAATASGITFQGSQWSFDNWGEDVLGLRRGGNIYYYDADVSISPERMKPVTSATNAPHVTATSAPTQSNFILVSPNDRHAICFATNEFGTGDFNSMLVRWSDQEDFTNWTPAINTTSGETALADGTEIIGAVRTRSAILIWTDNALYSMSFIGGRFVFSFNQLGTNCGLIAPHAAIDYDGVSYWMGDNNFYAYDGRVQNLPCTVRRHLFENFNNTNKDKVYAGINSEFKEIIWLYPKSGSTEPNAYIIYNTEEKTWVFGDSFYTTFKDRTVYENTITTGKVSATGDTFLWDNEPEDVYTGDGTALSSFLESSSFDVGEGDDLMFLNRIIPDYKFDSGQDIEIFVKVKEFPSDNFKIKGPFTINANTKKVDFRARGRQASVKVSGTNDGGWRWGSVRLALQPDGKR